MTDNYEHEITNAFMTLLDKPIVNGKRSITVSKVLTHDLVYALKLMGFTVTVKHDKYSDGIYIK